MVGDDYGVRENRITTRRHRHVCSYKIYTGRPVICDEHALERREEKNARVN